MSAHLRQELESILNNCKEKKLWDNNDRVRLKRLRMELGKVSQVAKVVNVSKATLRWWEREESENDQLRPAPPYEKVSLFRDLLIEKHFRSLLQGASHGEGPSSRSVYDVFLRMRDFSEIMERAKSAENLWAFRFGRPFKAGMDQQVFDDTAQFVLAHKTKVFFVFREPEPNDPETPIYEAKKSFTGILQKIAARPAAEKEKLYGLMHGISIKGADADKLGLTDPWSCFSVAEYSDTGYMKYQRTVDVWIENLFEGAEENRPVWLELPPSEAVKWRQRRSSILSEALKRAASVQSGIKKKA